jgi:hypothetical protein
MADELTDEEKDLLARHRAEKAKDSRKVRVRGKHESGADYEFDLDGEEAETVIARHSGLWAKDGAAADEKPAKGSKPAYFGGKGRAGGAGGGAT